MKKITVFILLACMMLSLCACSVEEEKTPYVPGTVVGDRYENSDLGFGFTLPEGWEFLDSDGEMTAAMADGMASVSVTVEDMGALYGELLSAEEYRALVSENLTDDMENAGYTEPAWEMNQPVFLGAATEGIHSLGGWTLGDGQSHAYYTQTVYIMKDGRMITVAAHSFLDDLTGDILALFFSL